jgi:hypothetical protein
MRENAWVHVFVPMCVFYSENTHRANDPCPSGWPCVFTLVSSNYGHKTGHREFFRMERSKLVLCPKFISFLRNT